MTHFLKAVIALALICALSNTTAAEEPDSAFGCSGLENDRELPTVEGRDGVFFRIRTDLRMNHPNSARIVAQIGALSEALARRGTTLVYAPIPTKSVTMPDFLPARARLYGFDLYAASRVHDDLLERLNAVGVQTVDIRSALLKTEPGKRPFFNTDFHWTAYGARLGAQEISSVIKSLPAYDALDKTSYVSTIVGEEVAFSGMRRILQKQCVETLPLPVTQTYDTRPVASASEESAGLDLFGETAARPQLALVGTSFSDSPINNFPGFLAEYSELEVVNYAITGGNQFGSITSLLTSEEFQEAPPTFLVWENPIYNNLAIFGDQPMRELIAAADNNCDRDLGAQISTDGKTLTASIAGMKLGPDQTLMLDSDGSPSLGVTFRFVSTSGRERLKVIERGERWRRTGRFYMPMTGLWPEGAEEVEVILATAAGPDARLTVCSPQNTMETDS